MDELRSLSPYQIERREKAIELADKITNFVNTMSRDNEDFNKAMERQHKTLQNSFTRLCVGWLEYIATTPIYVDGRNESGVAFAKKMVELFQAHAADERCLEEINQKLYFAGVVDKRYYSPWSWTGPLTQHIAFV